MARRFQVVIVGGGPVGVALAVGLGLRGISCAVIERRTGLQNIPKGQNLSPRTL
jgi:2-polyprenyl-6-methoxyphenol hydroxylase-like FAD-dependent oxidoreductase